MAGRKRVSKFVDDPSKRIHPLILSSATLLGCASRGVYLSPAMRLVGVMMLLWVDEWERLSEGRVGMTYDEIADRTSLTAKQVEATLEKMATVRLVEQRADGWILTLDRWKESVLRAWRDTPTASDLGNTIPPTKSYNEGKQ